MKMPHLQLHTDQLSAYVQEVPDIEIVGSHKHVKESIIVELLQFVMIYHTFWKNYEKDKKSEKTSYAPP